MQPSLGKIRGTFLVRDKNGKPKIDDIYNIPESIWNMLSGKEQLDIVEKRNGSNTSRNNS